MVHKRNELYILFSDARFLGIPLTSRKRELKKIFTCLYIYVITRLFRKCFCRKGEMVDHHHHTRLFPKVNGIMPFVIGVFLSGSVWILKFTYKNFYLYVLVNFLVDTFFTYPFYSLFKNLGVWNLIRLKQYQLTVLFSIKSLLMYVFQKYVGERLYSKIESPVSK